MTKTLALLAICALLLTGCSSPTPASQPEYDQLELAIYQSCVDAFMKQLIEPQYSGLGVSSLDVIRKVNGLCDPFKPVKK